MMKLVLQQNPHADPTGCVGQTCLTKLRADHVRQLLQEDMGELSALDEEVLKALGEGESVGQHVPQVSAGHCRRRRTPEPMAAD